MKRSILLVPVLSLGLAFTAFAGVDKTPLAPQPAPPEEKPLGVTATLGYDTNYIFRGVQFAENLVSGKIDWVVPLNQTFSIDVNAWYGSSADDSAQPFAGGGSYEELDLSAALLAKVGSFTIGVKYTWYDYLGNASHFVRDVNEVGLTAGTSVAGFDLSVGAYYDFTAEGFYFEYAASRTFKINDWLSVVPGVLISHAHDYYGVNGGNTFTPSLALPIKLCKTATLTPYIAGNIPYGSLHDLGEKRRVYGGVALSVSF